MLKDFFHLQNLQKVFNYYFGVVTKELRHPFFWDMTPLHWVMGSQPFDVIKRSHLQGSKCPRLLLSAYEIKRKKKEFY